VHDQKTLRKGDDDVQRSRFLSTDNCVGERKRELDTFQITLTYTPLNPDNYINYMLILKDVKITP